jgi:hypothetical protein
VSSRAESRTEIPRKWQPAVEELSRLVANGDPRAHGAFEALAAPLYCDLVQAELAALHADPSHGLTNRRFAGNIWVLFADAEITLSLSVVSEPDKALVSSIPHDVSIAAVGPGQLTVEHLRINVSADERDVLGREHRLELLATRQLSQGQALHLRGGTDVLRFVDCPQPMPILSLNAQRSKVRLTWDYDTHTLLPVACSLVDATASQIVFLLGVAEAHGRTDHLPFVEQALRHSAHSVRWAVVKALWKLDPQRALDVTRARLDDEHPHVRRAAERTLQLFETQHVKEAACR